ncbi:MAG: GNAT family N-acetyltransferase, partial [Pirellulales bacterium]|nr:GNAT family N-acetyltransferase [Pirellulales bacterium]
MHVRLAFSSEAGKIVEIFRANFPQDRLGYTIYASCGVESYIRDLIDHHDHGDSLWYVLVDDGEVQGFTEIRRGPQDVFVNHGYLDPSVRAPGVGTSLLYHGMAHARNAGQTRAGLDVFDDNTSVRRGHRALGFRE